MHNSSQLKTVRVLYRTTRAYYPLLCFCMGLCLLGSTNIMDITNFSNLLGSSSSFKKSKTLSKRKWKNLFEMIINCSLTTNCIAAVHGLYLLAAHSHSFQSLFSFWMEHVRNGLPTMANKRR